jgi:hypothetical protein
MSFLFSLGKVRKHREAKPRNEARTRALALHKKVYMCAMILYMYMYYALPCSDNVALTFSKMTFAGGLSTISGSVYSLLT